MPISVYPDSSDGGSAPIDSTLPLHRRGDVEVLEDGTTWLKSGVIEDLPRVYPNANALPILDAAYTSSRNIGSVLTASASVCFSADGYNYYLSTDVGDYVYHYELNEPFKIDTLRPYKSRFYVSTQDSVPRGIHITEDGLTFYLIGDSSNTVYQYDLSDAFDTGTMVYSGKSFSVATESTVPYDVVLKDDGTKMYVIDGTTGLLSQYTLSTPYDVTTAVVDVASIATSNETTSPRSINFSSDGSKIFIFFTTGYIVYRYDLTTPWDLSAYTVNASTLALDTSIITTTQSAVTTPNGKYVCPICASNYHVYQVELSTPYDLSTEVYDYNFLDISSETYSAANSITWSEDGTSFFKLGDSTEEHVTQYNMTTPYDVTTATFYDSFYTGSQGTDPMCIDILPGGTSFYVLSSSILYRYSMTRAYDLTSATYNISYSLTEAADPTGFSFSRDGYNLYVLSDGDSKIYRYTMAVPFDVTNKVFDSVNSIDSSYIVTPGDIRVTNDGLGIYAKEAASDEIVLFSLSVPYDLSSYSGTTIFATKQVVGAKGLGLSSDGEKFITAQGESEVWVYNALKGVGIKYPCADSDSNLPIYLRVE